jgi:CDP-diglyceride synthetase
LTEEDDMLGIIGALLVVWLVVVVLGIAIKGLLWLAIIGAVLFVATAVGGWARRS